MAKKRRDENTGQLSLFDMSPRTNSVRAESFAASVPDKNPAVPETNETYSSDLFLASAPFDLEGGEKALFRRNMDALQVLKSLRDRNAELASTREKEILARYMGWGGCASVFDSENRKWTEENQELRDFLSPVEYRQARNSIQNAYYTSDSVIRGVWAGLERMGVRDRWMRALEPSAGIGNFASYRPANLNPEFHFVEQDAISSAILGWLYPQSQRFASGFQLYWQTNPVYDLAIGNPPFGQATVYDPNFSNLNSLSIHNYFLNKSIRLVCEGGIGAFVVSRYFMDAAGEAPRGMIAQRARFLGAIRLPGQAFEKSARVSVITDIVFFQRHAGENNNDWIHSDGLLNDYFRTHPEMVVGEIEQFESSRYGGKTDIRINFDGDLEKEIRSRIRYLPENIFVHRDKPAESADGADREFIQSPYFQSLKTGAFFRTPKAEIGIKNYNHYDIYEPKDSKSRARLDGMITIRDALRALMEAEKNPSSEDAALRPLRIELNRKYDEFIRKYGYLHNPANFRLMGKDPEWPLVMALETDYHPGISDKTAADQGIEPKKAGAGKADIFFKRILRPDTAGQSVTSIEDALFLSLQLHGRVNLSYISGILGKDAVIARNELLYSGKVFLNPRSRELETREKYLSGDVREKLKEAVAANELENGLFASNIAELENVLPGYIHAADISAPMAASWIPADVFTQFIEEITGGSCRVSLEYVPVIGKWELDLSIWNYVFNNQTYGTDDCDAEKIIKHIFAGTPVVVKDAHFIRGERVMIVNQEKTLVAKQRMERIKSEFSNWIWQDDDRRHRLEEIYNNRFNSWVPPVYDGSHLKPAGMSSAVSLRPHQKNAVWRAMQDGSVLFDHVVGSGKTMIAIVTIMESKRVGLMSKPMIVVPNHLLSPWMQEFYRLYPSANILCATNEDFSAKNRERLFARIAMNNWDAVIVPHSSFAFIPAPVQFQQDLLERQEAEYLAAIENAKRDEGMGGKSLIRSLERARDSFRKRIEKLLDRTRKTNVADFADLGIDAMFVDESQSFKNLFFSSSMRVSGLGTQEGSGKALDMFIKCRYIQERNNGRGVYFMTGTPISNTIAELYTIQRYLRYDKLKEMGLTYFDEWASVFGQVVDNWELDSTGVKYKLVSRFAKFQNVGELLRFYRSFADVVTQDGLEKAGLALPVPKIMNDAPVNNVSERSDYQAEYMGRIISRMQNLPSDPSVDNPLKITNDARKAGLDYRLIDPWAPDYDDSKINLAVQKIYEIWRDTEKQKGTQLVFCDLSTPRKQKKAGKEVLPMAARETHENGNDEDIPVTSMDDIVAGQSDFSVYDDMRDKLLALGVPANEIAFIHNADNERRKQLLYGGMNNGEIRILFGSTSKMGAGTNVQKRLVALHNMDAPWRPSDIEQRNGRIIRQGNVFYEADPENFRVQIHNYATKQTYDSRMWQLIEHKSRAIDQFRQGNVLQRVIDDVSVGSATAAEMKAAASGNPLILEEVQLASELRSLEADYAEFLRSQHRMRDKLPWLAKSEERLVEAQERYEKDRETLAANTRKVTDKNGQQRIEWIIRTDSESFGEGERLKKHFDNMAEKCHRNQAREFYFGTYRGFGLYIKKIHTMSRQMTFGDGVAFFVKGHGKDMYSPGNLVYDHVNQFNTRGFFQKLDNFFAGNFREEYGKAVENAGREQKEFEQIKVLLDVEFPQMERFNAVRERHEQVIMQLKLEMEKEKEENDCDVSQDQR